MNARDGLPNPEQPETSRHVAPWAQRARTEEHELELQVKLEPGATDMAWGFAYWVFRVERVEWDGPALVNWLGHLMTSPFEPLEQDSRMNARPRVHVIGDPVCFVVKNPTTEPIEVVLRARGTIAVNGSPETPM